MTSRSGTDVRAALTAIGGAAVVTVVVLVMVAGSRPTAALRAFFWLPIANRFYFGNLLDTATLLALTGTGIVVAFRGGLFNLGGEGQVYAGGLAAAVVGAAWLGPGAHLPGAGIWGPIVMVAAGIGVGCLLAAVSALLKSLLSIDELITSFLVSSAVTPLVTYAITGPLRNPGGNLLSTTPIAESLRLPRLLLPSRLDSSALIAVFAVIVVAVWLLHTTGGFRLRISGLNRRFAHYVGLPTVQWLVVPLVVSGGFHGMAGALTVAGTHYAAIAGFTYGLGWNGIAVALIARLHPLWVLPAAIVMAYLDAGAKAAMVHTSFSLDLAAVIQAVILLVVTAELFVGRRTR